MFLIFLNGDRNHPGSLVPEHRGAAEIQRLLHRADPETPYWLHGFPNGTTEPMFAVNAEITPASESTWSGVKSMFD